MAIDLQLFPLSPFLPLLKVSVNISPTTSNFLWDYQMMFLATNYSSGGRERVIFSHGCSLHQETGVLIAPSVSVEHKILSDSCTVCVICTCLLGTLTVLWLGNCNPQITIPDMIHYSVLSFTIPFPLPLPTGLLRITVNCQHHFIRINTTYI